MNDLSRRRFLGSTFGVAVVGALAVVPGLASILKQPTPALAQTATAGLGQADLAGPLVAHVRDLNSGEISLLVGTQHVVQKDRDLAARLYAAARRAVR